MSLFAAVKSIDAFSIAWSGILSALLLIPVSDVSSWWTATDENHLIL